MKCFYYTFLSRSFFSYLVSLYMNQILNLCNCKEDVRNKVHIVIDKFAERGLRSLAVARQVSCASLLDCVRYVWKIFMCLVWRSFDLFNRKFLREPRRVPADPGNLLGCYPSLILQDMTVPKLFAGLSILVLMWRWLLVTWKAFISDLRKKKFLF